MAELPIIAEGDGPDGKRWFLRAGGSSVDYYTMLGIVAPDGRRVGGIGMGGPPLHSGSLFNSSTGRADDGLLRLIIRAAPRVRRVHLWSVDGRCDLRTAGADLTVGLTFFAALLPWTGIDGMALFDAVGQPLTD